MNKTGDTAFATKADIQKLAKAMRKSATKAELKQVEKNLRKDILRLEARAENIEERVGSIEERVESIEGKVEVLHEGQQDIKQAITKLQNTLDGFVKVVDDLRIENEVGTHQVRELEKRVTKLELQPVR